PAAQGDCTTIYTRKGYLPQAGWRVPPAGGSRRRQRTASRSAQIDAQRPGGLRLGDLGLVGSGAEDVVAESGGHAEPVVLVLVVVEPMPAPDRAVVAATRPVWSVDQEVTPLVGAEDH